MSTDKKPKIVVLGSCGVDFTSYAPRLPKPGETLHGTKFLTSFGGKGANQCVAAARLGGNTFMICKVGDDQWGQKYKDNLKENGVDISNAYTAQNATTGVAQIIVAEDGENQIVIVPGANALLSKDDIRKSAELIKNADILIAQLETPFESTLEAFKLNATGLKLFNAAPAIAKIQEILPYCSILCVNENEASILTDLKVNDISDAAIALRKLLTLECETVIITLGGSGAIYATKTEKRPIHVLCDSVKPVDTTGAGDAFVGALATLLVTHKEYPLHQLIGAACQYASISVTKEGTQTSYSTNFKPFEKEYVYNSFK